jgi:hypothetical protein
MDYKTAAGIIAEVAPDLIVGPDTGLPHINVHKVKGGAPFSIGLPTCPPGNEEPDPAVAAVREREMLEHGIASAIEHL